MSHRQVTRISLLAPAFALAFGAFAANAAGAPGSAAAKTGATTVARPAPPAPSPLATERAALKAQLEKVNAEIDGLKHAGGVRDDYRLRARLADAEALARRLIELDAKLGIRADGAHTPAPAPIAAPTDSAADLDAKADILTDQARRFRAQADGLAARAQALKGRQELRRRAADLDRDPFAPMEGSKRRMASASPTATTAGERGAAQGDSSLTPTSGPAVSGAAPPSPSPSSPAPVLSGLSLQFRDLLDTATLADIRRLEGTGTATGTLQALERAAAALRGRADQLDGRARDMRPKRP
jgi:hypothetical protein